MKKQYTCFVISPIGETGSSTRMEADYLLKLIIEPVFHEFGFSVLRGDHETESTRIDSTVIKHVRDSDICVCNLSEPRPNVYYELGWRDAVDKPVILMKAKNTEELPVDIATRRYINYDFSPQGIIDACEELRKHVTALLKNGLDQSKKDSMSLMMKKLDKLESKIDQMTATSGNKVEQAAIANDEKDKSNDLSPDDQFRLALIQGDIKMAEEAMDRLKVRMEELNFYDLIVQQVAAMGSDKAGQMLIDFAEEFFDSDMSFHKKVEYLGCLVTYGNKSDREGEIVELVESVCSRLLVLGKDEDEEDIATIYNQLNRLYYGIFMNTNDKEWLDKAVEELKIAISIKPARHHYYNLALCLKRTEQIEEAIQYIERCLEMDEEEEQTSADHLALACELYHQTDNPRFDDTFDKLSKESPNRALLLKHRLQNN